MKNKILITILLLAPGLLVFPQGKQWTYKECLEYALQNNISIKQKALSRDMTSLNLEKAKANRIPSLSASANQNLSFGRSLDSYTNDYTTNHTYSNDYSLGTSVTLFNGFQNTYNIKKYQTDLEADGYDLEKLQNDIMLNVVQAYLQVLLAEEQLGSAREVVKSSQALVDRTEKLVKAGNKAMNDLLQVKSQLSTDQYTLTVRENTLQMAKVSLMQLMELPVDTSFRISPPVASATAALTPDPAQVFDSAMLILPEIKSMELRTRSSEYSYAAAKGSALPRLTLSGNINTGYSNARSLYDVTYTPGTQEVGYLQSDPSQKVMRDVMIQNMSEKNYPYGQQLSDNLRQSISLGLSIPIFNNKQIRTNKALAKIDLENERLTAQTTRNTLRKTIEQNLTDLNAARNNRAAAAEQLASAKESYRNAEAKYVLGMLNSTDLLVEKKNLTQAESNLIQAKYEELFQSRITDFYLGNNIEL
jgi:outer membrane protein